MVSGLEFVNFDEGVVDYTVPLDDLVVSYGNRMRLIMCKEERFKALGISVCCAYLVLISRKKH